MTCDLKPVAAGVAAILVAVVVLTAAPCCVAQAQAPPPSCASKLVPCAAYMSGTTTPPDTCCKPLKETVTNDLVCLCAIYNDPEILKAFSIRLQDAVRLARRCGIDSTNNQCSGPSPTKSPPGGGKNAGYRTTSIGLPGLMSLSLFLWSVLA